MRGSHRPKGGRKLHAQLPTVRPLSSEILENWIYLAEKIEQVEFVEGGG